MPTDDEVKAKIRGLLPHLLLSMHLGEQKVRAEYPNESVVVLFGNVIKTSSGQGRVFGEFHGEEFIQDLCSLVGFDIEAERKEIQAGNRKPPLTLEEAMEEAARDLLKGPRGPRVLWRVVERLEKRFSYTRPEGDLAELQTKVRDEAFAATPDFALGKDESVYESQLLATMFALGWK